MLYDTIIIGAGPSGVTCAIYLKRAGLNPLVIYKDAGSLGLSKIENLYSYDSISGIDLFNKGLEQLKFHKIDTVKEEVLALTQELNFKAITKDNEYEGKTLVIASGLNKSNLPKMFKDYLG
ncbi:MAG: FAD-dependent oxidoreductase, partial [Gammaproteobacteria bacterium]|nr:FAD-dependent oxidoreductase [Gammaproteobacteria bacterium]